MVAAAAVGPARADAGGGAAWRGLGKVAGEVNCPSLSCAAQVGTEHLMLGLISEDTTSLNGYLNSGLTVERVRGIVEALTRKKALPGPNTDVPFTLSVRKTFEAAANVGSGGRRSPDLLDCMPCPPAPSAINRAATLLADCLFC